MLGIRSFEIVSPTQRNLPCSPPQCSLSIENIGHPISCEHIGLEGTHQPEVFSWLKKKGFLDDAAVDETPHHLQYYLRIGRELSNHGREKSIELEGSEMAIRD